MGAAPVEVVEGSQRDLERLGLGPGPLRGRNAHDVLECTGVEQLADSFHREIGCATGPEADLGGGSAAQCERSLLVTRDLRHRHAGYDVIVNSFVARELFWVHRS